MSFELISKPQALSKRPRIYKNLMTVTDVSKDFYLFFDGFKSMCPVTSSPDFATIYLSGQCLKSQSTENLKKYLFSYASKQEFHELCFGSIIQWIFLWVLTMTCIDKPII